MPAGYAIVIPDQRPPAVAWEATSRLQCEPKVHSRERGSSIFTRNLPGTGDVLMILDTDERIIQ
jgi:hypothetical protein